MTYHYLPDGKAVVLKEKLSNGKYIVNEVFDCIDMDSGDGYIDVSDKDIVVEKILEDQPVAHFEKEIADLLEAKVELEQVIKALHDQKYALRAEVNDLTKRKIANDKLIIDRNELINAKEIVIFIEGKPMPLRMENDERAYGLNLSINIDIRTGEESAWGAKLHFDQGYDSGSLICKQYGYLIDPTPEEVERITKERIQTLKFDLYRLVSVDKKYLTDAQIKEVHEYRKAAASKKLADLNKQQADLTKKINKAIALIESPDPIS